MKKIILFFLISSTCIAQWNYLPNSPENMYWLYFLNSETGFAVGGPLTNSVIMKTTNGGSNWYNVNIPGSYGLRRITFVNGNTGYCVGEKILKTEDGGNNWFLFPDPFNYIYGVDFIESNTAWVCTHAGQIGLTTNAGNNWTFYFNLTNENLFSASFVNQNVGGFCGIHRIINTKDGGSTWNIDTLANNLVTISYADTNYAFAGGSTASTPQNPYFLKTTNGGDTWFEIPFPQKATTIFTLDITHIWVSCLEGYIFFSSDTGNTWNNQFVFTLNHITDIFMIDQNTGYAAAFDGILKTTNGGNPFSSVPFGNKAPLKFQLTQNYPNPFNPTTIIEFDIPKTSFTKLTVFDVTGRKIRTLVNEILNAGHYRENFNGSSLSSGMYFYTLETNEFKQTKRMVLLK